MSLLEDPRPERSVDILGIHAVHARAFPTGAEAALVDAGRGAGRLSPSLVVCDAGADALGRVAGHIAFSPVSAPGAHGGVGLAPLAVVPEARRHGVGAALVRAGLQACRQAGHRFVVVLGDPAYYSRFGFEPASKWGLSDEYGGGDAFQAIELVAGAIPETGGLVRYSPEFAELDEQ